MISSARKNMKKRKTSIELIDNQDSQKRDKEEIKKLQQYMEEQLVAEGACCLVDDPEA